MPIKKTVLAREPQPVPEQEEIEERAELPAFEPAEAEATQPERPHQAFVESQLRQYLHDNNIRSLVKPTQEEIRAAAMPILCQARRPQNRTGPAGYRASCCCGRGGTYQGRTLDKTSFN